MLSEPFLRFGCRVEVVLTALTESMDSTLMVRQTRTRTIVDEWVRLNSPPSRCGAFYRRTFFEPLEDEELESALDCLDCLEWTQ